MLTKTSNLDKYNYSGYGTGFGACRKFLLSDGSEFYKNVIILGADTSSLVHIDNKKDLDYW